MGDSDGTKIFVYGVSADIPRDLLEDKFEKFGRVKEIFNSGKGYAFITMDDERDAKAAIEELTAKKSKLSSLNPAAAAAAVVVGIGTAGMAAAGVTVVEAAAVDMVVGVTATVGVAVTGMVAAAAADVMTAVVAVMAAVAVAAAAEAGVMTMMIAAVVVTVTEATTVGMIKM